MTIGEKIKYCRKQIGITQDKLAELTGIHPVSIRKYETNKMQPQPPQLEKIAAALGVSYNALNGSDTAGLRLETVGDLMGVLMVLCNSGILQINGARGEDTLLKDDTVSIYLNPVLSSYLEIRYNLTSMKKNKRLFILLTLYFSISQIDAQTPLSFEESLHLLNQGNQSLKIADKSIEIAKAERDKLNAFWYPSLQSTGAFVHMSEKIEVKQPLSQFTDPAKDFVHSIIPDDQVISSILDQIGANTLVFPLTPRNLTTVDLSAEWVLFSGGKRFRATNIGRTMVDLARESRAQVSANQQNLLVESYYGLRLAQQIVTVREETYNGLKKHYENALKLEAAGMIDKAGRLFAQVNMDEAKRALEAARKEETVVQSALKVLLNKKDTDANIIPTSPLFMNDSLPPKMLFDLSVNSGNYTLNQLQLQQHIAKQEVRIAQSGYLPNIALFGKQTLYSHGIQSNLLPRTMIGIGFTWNLFDGLDREKKVRQSKLTEQTLALGQMKARDDLAVGVDKLYTQLEKAQDNVKALNATITLSEELVRIRKKSFTEGMATSTEVIDAETMLATVKVARLAAYYEYDVALINLLSLCGTPEQFANYQPKP